MLSNADVVVSLNLRNKLPVVSAPDEAIDVANPLVSRRIASDSFIVVAFGSTQKNSNWFQFGYSKFESLKVFS